MPAVTGSPLLDTLIGLIVSLIASIMNAAGLNLLKLDHVRNSVCSQERQRHECGRPLWHVGLYLYVGSQLAGSTIALNFLKAQWVAPLGSIALIFNFIFAKILVGTKITRKDVLGTIVVMFSVVWIVIFGGMNSVLNMVVFTLLSLGLYAYWAISLDDESGQIRKKMKTKLTKKVVAMIMATSGGLLASQTLLLAKSGIKLVTSTFAGHNQFYDMLSSFILFILVFTAILQASIHIVYCMNTALKLYDSVLVVPMFYGYYTAFGLINSTIYLNQIHSYQPWVLILILLGIGLLIFGVRMLS
ncbi:hypothetical protein EDD21DRAFT_308994, partial [Dissophora ornata]